jgi:hypothetical protein
MFLAPWMYQGEEQKMAKRMQHNAEQIENAQFNYMEKVKEVFHMMMAMENHGSKLELHPNIRERFEIAKSFRQKWMDMPLYVEVDE